MQRGVIRLVGGGGCGLGAHCGLTGTRLLRFPPELTPIRSLPRVGLLSPGAHPSLKDYKEKDKWDKVAALVEGKNRKQCTERYKYLATRQTRWVFFAQTSLSIHKNPVSYRRVSWLPGPVIAGSKDVSHPIKTLFPNFYRGWVSRQFPNFFYKK